MTEKEIVQNRLKTSSEYWSIQDLEKIAHMDVPHSFLGRQRTLLKGDINELWVRWFIESIADPLLYRMRDSKYSTLYADVSREVHASVFFEMTGPERKEIAINIRLRLYWLTFNIVNQQMGAFIAITPSTSEAEYLWH